MTCSALDIANYIIRRQADKNVSLTPMQLIKIVYLCHGWHLGVTKEPLVSEPIEAWAYGPVVRSVYDQFKRYRGGAIDAPQTAPSLPAEKAKLIDAIADHYSQFSGIRLSKLTHTPESPWEITWRTEGKNAIISDDLIEDYYAKQVSTNDDRASSIT